MALAFVCDGSCPVVTMDGHCSRRVIDKNVIVIENIEFPPSWVMVVRVNPNS